jgi:small multidrug resistance pump
MRALVLGAAGGGGEVETTATLYQTRGRGPAASGPRRRSQVHWIYLAIAIAAEVVGTSSLKASAGFTKLGPSLMVLAGYGVAFLFLSLTLERIPVGVGYAIWSGAGVTLIALIGWLVYGEKLDPAAIAGMALIVAGVVVLNLFSKTAAH